MHKCRVIFGSESSGQEPSEYSFNTEAELLAFIDGMEAAVGWMEYEILEDGEE
jgi:hypothetical protein